MSVNSCLCAERPLSNEHLHGYKQLLGLKDTLSLKNCPNMSTKWTWKPEGPSIDRQLVTDLAVINISSMTAGVQKKWKRVHVRHCNGGKLWFCTFLNFLETCFFFMFFVGKTNTCLDSFDNTTETLHVILELSSKPWW